MSLIKNKQEIDILRHGGKILANVLETVRQAVKPGITTAKLNELAESLIYEAGGRPSFKGYGSKKNAYPAGLCTSVNEQLVHGIPSSYVLQEGDIVGLDIGMQFPKNGGLFTDMAITVPVGTVDVEKQRLIKSTEKALALWIEHLKPGRNMNDISRKVQYYIESCGYGVVRDLVGHGVGHAVHEEPQVPNYAIPGFHFMLKEGMVLALEPMVTMGDYHIETQDDGWTVATVDGSLTSHCEHTVVITASGCEVLTNR